MSLLREDVGRRERERVVVDREQGNQTAHSLIGGRPENLPNGERFFRVCHATRRATSTYTVFYPSFYPPFIPPSPMRAPSTPSGARSRKVQDATRRRAKLPPGAESEP